MMTLSRRSFLAAAGATLSTAAAANRFEGFHIGVTDWNLQQTGKFEAIRTTSMMVHSTYYLPDEGKTWIGGGYGTIYSSNALGAAIGSFLGGVLHDFTGGYTATLILSLVLVIFAVMPFWTVPALRTFR